MRTFFAVRRAWPVRLIGALFFVVVAASLTYADGLGRSSGRTATPNVVGPPLTITPAQDARSRDEMRTPEGVRIVVVSGSYAAAHIYTMLVRNGLDAVTGAHLTVWVQRAYPGSRVTWSSDAVGAGRDVRRATMWLDAWPGSDFSSAPERTVALALGRIWSARYLKPRLGFWTAYLEKRGIARDPRVGTTGLWDPNEIIADDYRLLFGSAEAITELPRSANPALRDPRSIDGFREFLLDAATAAHLPTP